MTHTITATYKGRTYYATVSGNGTSRVVLDATIVRAKRYGVQVAEVTDTLASDPDTLPVFGPAFLRSIGATFA